MPLADGAASVLRGPLTEAGGWPILLHAVCCDLRPAFLPKARVGLHHRAVARNGRVLLASDRALADLPGRAARMRLQTWHKAVLPGANPEPHGILLCVRTTDPPAAPPYEAHLTRQPCDERLALSLDVGGLRFLVFRPVIGKTE
jgi:hypothetical protein